MHMNKKIEGDMQRYKIRLWVMPASGAVSMRSWSLWNFTQCKLVFCYCRFGTNYRSRFKG